MAVERALGAWRDVRDLARTYGRRGLLLRARHELELRSGLLDRLATCPAPAAGWTPVPVDLAPARRFFTAHPERASEAIADGERVLAGRLPFFGAIEVDAGWPPRWLDHPVTGRRWPGDRPWSELSTTDPELGDIKWIWEPARFGFAWTLARAALVENDPRRWCRALLAAIESFVAACPPYRGPNWYCGQEVAVRVLALEVAFGVLAALGWHPTEEERAGVQQLLADSGRRIAATLGHSLAQRNNHALSELAGLWAIALACPGLPDTPAWRARVIAELAPALDDQFARDGAYVQESFVYHRLALHVLLLVRWVSARRGQPEPTDLAPALERSAGFLRAFMEDASGETPNTGASDGSRLVPVAGGAMCDMRPLLAHLLAALGRPPALEPGPWDEERCWFGYPEPAPGDVTPIPVPPLVVCPSGYVASRRGPATLFLRVPSHAHHRPSHADALHLDVFVGGRAVAIDPGTFAYTALPPWDNGLARTRVHNTASVDDVDQMKRRGRFLWTRWTRASLEVAEERGDRSVLRARCAADSDGRVVHERLIIHTAQGAWVLDALRADRPRRLRIHWNLSGAWQDVGLGPGLELASDDVRVAMVWAGDARPMCVVGDPAETLGWASPTYGVRVPCTAIEAEAVGASARFATAFTWSAAAWPAWWTAAWSAWQAGRLHDAARAAAGT